MTSFRASLVNEMEKIALRRKTAGLLLFTLLLPSLLALLERYARGDFGLALYTGSGFPLAVLGIMTDYVLPLLLIMQAADSWTSEFSEGTIKLSWMRPLSRWKLFASKQLSLVISIGVFLVVSWVSAVAAALLFQIGDLSLSTVIQSLLAYLVAIVPMTALSTAAVWINQWLKSPTTAVMLGILFYMGARLSAFFLDSLLKYSPVAYTDWHLLWLGGIDWSKLASIFLFLAGCSIVCFTIAFYQFERKAI
jgi:ABC-2 type transport system permease protein